MRVRQPADVDPLLWDLLPQSTRLALTSRYAGTPEKAAALVHESDRLTLAALQKAVKKLEKAQQKGRGER